MIVLYMYTPLCTLLTLFAFAFSYKASCCILFIFAKKNYFLQNFVKTYLKLFLLITFFPFFSLLGLYNIWVLLSTTNTKPLHFCVNAKNIKIFLICKLLFHSFPLYSFLSKLLKKNFFLLVSGFKKQTITFFLNFRQKKMHFILCW